MPEAQAFPVEGFRNKFEFGRGTTGPSEIQQLVGYPLGSWAKYLGNADVTADIQEEVGAERWSCIMPMWS